PSDGAVRGPEGGDEGRTGEGPGIDVPEGDSRRGVESAEEASRHQRLLPHEGPGVLIDRVVDPVLVPGPDQRLGHPPLGRPEHIGRGDEVEVLKVAGWDGGKPPPERAGVGIERDQGFGEAGGTGPDTVAHAHIDCPPSYIDGWRRGHGAPKGWLTGRGQRAVGVRRTELGLRLRSGPRPTDHEWHAAAAWAVGVRHAGLLRGAYADVLGERLGPPGLGSGGGVQRDEGTAHAWVVEMRSLPDVDLAL